MKHHNFYKIQVPVLFIIKVDLQWLQVPASQIHISYDLFSSTVLPWTGSRIRIIDSPGTEHRNQACLWTTDLVTLFIVVVTCPGKGHLKEKGLTVGSTNPDDR